MFASRALTFILFSGVIFGLVTAGTLWVNEASIWLVALGYVLGGNVGVSLAGVLVYIQNSHPSDD